MLKGQAFKEYAAKLREKNATYKRLRAEYDKQVADLGILQRTEQVRTLSCLSEADVCLHKRGRGCDAICLRTDGCLCHANRF